MSTGQKCIACGSDIELVSFQARAADEAARTIESCPRCPIMARRVSMGAPPTSVPGHLQGPTHRRLKSAPVDRRASVVVSAYLEMLCKAGSWSSQLHGYKENLGRPVPVVTNANSYLARGVAKLAGEYAGKTTVLRRTTEISPVVALKEVFLYPGVGDPRGGAEADGDVAPYLLDTGRLCYVHKRQGDKRGMLTVSFEVGGGKPEEVRRGLVELHSGPWATFDILDFLSVSELSTAQNISPRAWDSGYTNLGDHVFVHKVDGERCYGLVYGSMFYMFRKGNGYPLVGWRALSQDPKGKLIILDLENTITAGPVLIDVITDREGRWSPASRDCAWVLSEFSRMRERLGSLKITIRRYYRSLGDASGSTGSVRYLTDGVMAMHVDGVTSKKMKKERSVELRVSEDLDLLSSDGHKVFTSCEEFRGLVPGTIVEVRIRLTSGGKKVVCRHPFVREDKASANSSGAVSNVLSSFRGVLRDDEVRRRAVLTWCNSLRSYIVRRAAAVSSAKKVILDVGTGSGQSLDELSTVAEVSYILVEKDPSRCELIKRRLRLRKVETDPRSLLSSVRSLKSGSSKYVLLNCSLEDIFLDSEVVTLLVSELKAATCVFSAHYVVPSLYELASYWGVPVFGCVYVYDGVAVGQCLVDSLGVKMERVSDSNCAVAWGRDERHIEPCTLKSHYETFGSAVPAIEEVEHPPRHVDEDVYDICSKVFLVVSE